VQRVLSKEERVPSALHKGYVISFWMCFFHCSHLFIQTTEDPYSCIFRLYVWRREGTSFVKGPGWKPQVWRLVLLLCSRLILSCCKRR
jgi:hypothetical protein